MKTDMLPSVTPQLVELEAFPFAVVFDDKSAMHISPKVYGASHNSRTLRCECGHFNSSSTKDMLILNVFLERKAL